MTKILYVLFACLIALFTLFAFLGLLNFENVERDGYMILSLVSLALAGFTGWIM